MQMECKWRQAWQWVTGLYREKSAEFSGPFSLLEEDKDFNVGNSAKDASLRAVSEIHFGNENALSFLWY